MKYSKKGWEKRKKDREGLKDFFETCVNKIKKEGLCCLECGEKLKGNVSEVAHVLPKGYFKSISRNNLNWIPLCGMYSSNQCHTNFDNLPIEKVKEMKIYSKIILIFAELETIITEKITYKHYDKYGQS